MDKLVKEQITFKLSEIDKLFSEYDLIFQKAEMKEPDLFELTVLGSVWNRKYI